MAATAQEAFDFLKNYIDGKEKNYPYWYAGIAENAKDRLFNGHNVNKDTDLWAHDTCIDNANARAAEKALLELKCDGGTGGGDYTSKDVYVYRKSSHTKP